MEHPQTTFVEADTYQVPPRLLMAIGRADNQIVFTADPLDGYISIQANGSAQLDFEPDDFDLVNDLLQRALGN